MMPHSFSSNNEPQGYDYKTWLIGLALLVWLYILTRRSYSRYTEKQERQKELERSPDDLTDQKIKKAIRPESSLAIINREILPFLNDDPLTKTFTQEKMQGLINPLYLAYMRKVSQIIHRSQKTSSMDQPDSIFYAASCVDIITPLLLLMASQSKQVDVFMIDNNATIVEEVKIAKAHFAELQLEEKIPEKLEKIQQRMYDQFYLLSAFDHTNSSQKVEWYFVLAFFLQQLGIKKLDRKESKQETKTSTQLAFTFQARHITFHFLTGDITKPQELPSSLNSKPYLYIDKASVDLQRNEYLPTLFGKIGKPAYAFATTKRIDAQFAQYMESYINTFILYKGRKPTWKEARNLQFIDNPCHILKAVKHPTLDTLFTTIIDRSEANEGHEATEYHLGTLHHSI